jgi:hypothetical protein
MFKALATVAAAIASLMVAAPAVASTTADYQFTSVEPVGGPVQSPFSCAVGTSCGSVTISGLGHATSDVIVFNNACGVGCNIRTITFDDGSTLEIAEQIVGIRSPGDYGGQGYGNVHFIRITQTIVGGTGRFVGASGSGSGTVTGAGGAVVVSASGTITFP